MFEVSEKAVKRSQTSKCPTTSAWTEKRSGRRALKCIKFCMIIWDSQLPSRVGIKYKITETQSG